MQNLLHFSSVYVIHYSWQSLLTGIAGEKSNTTDELFLFAKERPNILGRHALLNQSKENMHQREKAKLTERNK